MRLSGLCLVMSVLLMNMSAVVLAESGVVVDVPVEKVVPLEVDAAVVPVDVPQEISEPVVGESPDSVDTIWVVDDVVDDAQEREELDAEDNIIDNTQEDEIVEGGGDSLDTEVVSPPTNIWVVDGSDTDNDMDDESDDDFPEAFVDEVVEQKTKPVRVVSSPYRVQYNSVGVPLVSTVRSIDVTGGETSYCSMIARLNKQQFYPQGKVVRGLGGPGELSVGNATQLIQYGLYRGLLTRVPDYNLEEVLHASNVIAADVYLYKAWNGRGLTLADVTNFDPKDTVYDRYLMQGHRLVVFLGDDGRWYALDTIRGTKRTTPQPLSEYIQTPYNKSWGYYIHTDVANGLVVEEIEEEVIEEKNLYDIYSHVIPSDRWSLGPWSMVSLFDTFVFHQLDVVNASCSATVADDDYFFWGGLTPGGTGAFWYEEDREIWAVE